MDSNTYINLATSIDYKDKDGRELEEKYFRDICNHKNVGSSYFGKGRSAERSITAKCHFAHYFDPYLLLGPFQIEIVIYWPLRSIFHDFFTQTEMDWMMKYSLPRLSNSRRFSVIESAERERKSLLRDVNGRTASTVHKTVQAWLHDITYDEKEIIIQVDEINEDPVYEVLPLKDKYKFTVDHTRLLRVSKRIELATQLNVTTRHGSSPYQTTNYGLGGLVEMHVDPWGYEQGIRLHEERKDLVTTGDYIATLMGWLQDVPLGGGTGFPTKGYEGILRPKKGSAAFWINLLSCHRKDTRSLHGGCPVLKGSKWIVNKWIYSWDQWKSMPCDTTANTTIRPFKGMSLIDR